MSWRVRKSRGMALKCIGWCHYDFLLRVFLAIEQTWVDGKSISRLHFRFWGTVVGGMLCTALKSFGSARSFQLITSRPTKSVDDSTANPKNENKFNNFAMKNCHTKFLPYCARKAAYEFSSAAFFGARAQTSLVLLSFRCMHELCFCGCCHFTSGGAFTFLQIFRFACGLEKSERKGLKLNSAICTSKAILAGNWVDWIWRKRSALTDNLSAIMCDRTSP